MVLSQRVIIVYVSVTLCNVASSKSHYYASYKCYDVQYCCYYVAVTVYIYIYIHMYLLLYLYVMLLLVKVTTIIMLLCIGYYAMLLPLYVAVTACNCYVRVCHH